nr:hypothetical protein GCM10020185_46250 [Pseudomonas brassicacearum subsp. brassicacearum]
MPFVRTAVIKGTSQQQRQRIVDGIHQALVESIGMPEDELFNLVTDYDPEQFFSTAARLTVWLVQTI